MKLKDSFFQIKDYCKTQTGVDFTIRFNPQHLIYQVHFPGNPVTPGACIIQIIKELAIEVLQCNLFLKKCNNVKFLKVINPVENIEVVFSISIASENSDTHKINALVYDNEQQFAKLSMILINN